MAPADVAVLTILSIAVLRGLFLGLIRELFSVISLAAACMTVRFLTFPAADSFLAYTQLEWNVLATRIGMGVFIAILTIVLVRWIGKWVRRGAKAIGLGWMDRFAGGALGIAEGALVAGILVALILSALGRSHPVFESSVSVAALDAVRYWIHPEKATLPSVSAPASRQSDQNTEE